MPELVVGSVAALPEPAENVPSIDSMELVPTSSMNAWVKISAVTGSFSNSALKRVTELEFSAP